MSANNDEWMAVLISCLKGETHVRQNCPIRGRHLEKMARKQELCFSLSALSDEYFLYTSMCADGATDDEG